jgi:hypothetical protein
MGLWLPCEGFESPPGPLRSLKDALRKLAAVCLVLASLTLGIVGLGLATGGHLWGILLIAATPLGIFAATRVTPEGGTTGYFDRNI